MNFSATLHKLAEAGQHIIATAGHIFDLAKHSDNIPETVVNAVVDIAKDVHDTVKEHRDQHVKD